MKQAIFHPEARAEMRESVEFYEARLEGLGFRFLSAVERQRNGFPPTLKQVPRSVADSENGSFRVSPTTLSIESGRITFTSLPSLTIIVVRAIGAIGLIVANHRLKTAAHSQGRRSAAA